MKPVRWRWALNGAIIGATLVLSDLLFEWRGPMFHPWRGQEAIMSNIIQMLTVIGLCAGIGLLAGYFRDRRTIRGY